jgi:hypothetical protein
LTVWCLCSSGPICLVDTGWCQVLLHCLFCSWFTFHSATIPHCLLLLCWERKGFTPCNLEFPHCQKTLFIPWDTAFGRTTAPDSCTIWLEN